MPSNSKFRVPRQLFKCSHVLTFSILFTSGCFLVTLNNSVIRDEVVQPQQLQFGCHNNTEQIPKRDDFKHLEYGESTPEEKKVQKLDRIPIILYWNRYFSEEFQQFVPKNQNNLDCPYTCKHTADPSFGAEADIRVFHERNFDPADLPPNNPDALNIYFTLEPPYLTFSKYNRTVKEPPNYFNYTGSYRSRSYIYYPYDKFVPMDGSETADDVWTDEQVEEKIFKKTKSALIAMTNCGSESQRHKYVYILREHINITQVGKCGGTVQCAKDPGGTALRTDIDCMRKLNEEHHFYLAFENSVCPEYTSEKFWRMKQLIVPIVLSRAVVPKHIPANTYIAASDFDSPKHLADHLKYLMENKDEYKKFFQWTKLYRKTRITEKEVNVSCQLCKLAHKQPKHQIENYKDHWSRQECIPKYAFNLLRNSVNDLNSVRCAEQRLSQTMENTYRERKLNNFA